MFLETLRFELIVDQCTYRVNNLTSLDLILAKLELV